MDQERHQEIKRLFLEALELPRERWGSFLDEKAGSDEGLKHEVEALLGFHVGVDGTVPRVEPTPDELAAADVVVLLTDHDAFDVDDIRTHARYVFDCRHRLAGPNVESL